MPRPDLPPDLGPSFSVVAARSAGVSRSRLRARDLDHTFHGARAVADVELVVDHETDAARAYPRSAEVRRIHERAHQYCAVMSSRAFFSHITAAALWDAPLPSRIFRIDPKQQPEHLVFDPEVLEVSVPWPDRAPRGRGVNGHAVRPGLAFAVRHPISDLRIASPATTWVMLAGLLPHPYDLVAVADHFVRVRRPPHHEPSATVPAPLATIAQLTAALRAGRRASAQELHTALERVRTGAASRPETWTRLTIIDAGLPEPVVDFDVLDDFGGFLGRVDLAYPQWRIAIEYEGAHHGADGQRESDVDRYAGLEQEGWRVVRVTWRMVFQHPETIVRRVRAAIAQRAA